MMIGHDNAQRLLTILPWVQSRAVGGAFSIPAGVVLLGVLSDSLPVVKIWSLLKPAANGMCFVPGKYNLLR